MIIFSLILFILLFFIFVVFNNEQFLSYSVIKNRKTLNLSDKSCVFNLDKEHRQENYKYMNNLSNTLDSKKENKVLRDVSELMFYEQNNTNKDIYDLTSFNKNKNYINKLNFW